MRERVALTISVNVMFSCPMPRHFIFTWTASELET